MIEDVKKDRIIDGGRKDDEVLVIYNPVAGGTSVSWSLSDSDGDKTPSPSPAPGVDESPFMTSGEIEGTPLRLEDEDTPIDIGGSGNGPHFIICIYKMGCSITEAGLYSVDLGEEEVPYWTTLGKRESYKPRPSSNGVGAQTRYYARKDFLNCHLPGEWEISRDVELNPFKDALVFREWWNT
ncbi:MAK10-like protein [Tanacetum coccineum]